MAADDVRADQCQPAAEHLARAFGFLGKRWTAIILGHLSHGDRREQALSPIRVPLPSLAAPRGC